MQLEFYMPLWGNEDLQFSEFCARVRRAGFDGVEMNLPSKAFTLAERADYAKAATNEGLKFALQHVETNDADFVSHKHKLAELMRVYAQVSPQFINSHTGRDFFSLEENLELIDMLASVSAELGIPIYHETHRSRCNFAAHISAQFVKVRPDIKQTADFSHFCCVAETLLEDQAHNLELIIPSIHHIHARVGDAQSPQVNHPNAPEHKAAFDAHMNWWMRILKMAKARGDTHFTITPEFGPLPYMPCIPFTGMPVSNQWEINVFMKNEISRRWAERED
uniref:sugar phosphate isomerase/epimerase n=1 Tax=Ningiella ruwaisensis TaxID=2364274 RepID=UPI00109FC574|nr:sugar phosphate isomerase/epimerase [Ningiella ruwaisensis]